MKKLLKNKLVIILAIFLVSSGVVLASKASHSSSSSSVNTPNQMSEKLALGDVPPGSVRGGGGASSTGSVLGEHTEDNPLFFTVNVPARFNKDISAPNVVYSVNGDSGEIEIDNSLVAGNGIGISGRKISNTGILTLVAGTGVSIDGNKITNSGILELVAGDNISIDGNTITNDYSVDLTQSGWTDNGSTIVLTTTTDTVTLDTLTFGNATITNGKSFTPDTDLGSDLGSSALRFNNLWVANINSNSSQAFSGQTTFSYPPTDTTITQASVIINPTTSVANGQLLGLGIAGYQRALIDEDGDMILGYSDATSAPANDYPLSIYGHSGTNVSFINETGGAYFAGNVGIGTSGPGAKLDIDTGSNALGIRLRGTAETTEIADIFVGAQGTLTLSTKNGNSNYRYLDLQGANSEYGLLLRNSTGTSIVFANFYMNDATTDYLNIVLNSNNNTVGLVIQDGGNIGIGTTTPGAKLDVTGSTDVIQFIVQANSTQTVNLAEIQDSSSNVLAGFDERGILFSDGGIDTDSVYIGNDAGNIGHTDATFNVGIGTGSLDALTTGDSNTIIGHYAGTRITTGFSNASLGYGTLLYNTTGDSNTAIGNEAGRQITGSNNILLGYKAGYRQTTASNLFIVDNQQRVNAATELTNSILYGIMAADPTNQSLRVNGELQVMSGNVGIGTSSPGAKFHIAENIGTIPTLSTDNIALFQNNVDGFDGVGITLLSKNNGVGRIDFGNETDADRGSIQYNHTTPKMSFIENTVEVMTLRGGNVGIGAGAPSSKLDITTLALGTTQTTSSGLALVNTTAAAVGAQQISPTIRWSGLGWKTDATAASQAVDFRSFVVPVEGTANPSGYLTFQSSINGGSYSDGMVITSGGNVGIGVMGPTSSLQLGGDTNDISSGITFNDGVTGIYESHNALVMSAVSGTIGLANNALGGRLGSTNFQIVMTANSSTTPIFIPNKADADTGMGYGGDNILSLIAGGTNGLNVIDSGNVGIRDTSPSYSLDVTGMIRATEGIAIYTEAGTIDDTDFTETAIDGQMAVDSTNGRIYFRHSGGWHYVAQTAGFQIPEYETFSFSFEENKFDTSKPLADGDFLIPFVDKHLEDGAIHGLYTKFSDVKGLLFEEETIRIEELESTVLGLATAIPASDSATLLTEAIAEQGSFIETIQVTITSLTTKIENLIAQIASLTTRATKTETELTELRNKTLAGTAVILKDSDEVAIVFEKAFEETPIITSTTDALILSGIKDKNANGFTIYLDGLANQDTSFSWVAVSAKNTSSFTSQPTIIPSPTLTPTLTPTSIITPEPTPI